MSMGIIIAEAAIFSIFFPVMAFATTGKKSRLQVHNYPPEIQEEYFRTHERMEVQPLSSRVFDPRGIRQGPTDCGSLPAGIKAVGILIFTVILAVCACAAGAEKFVEGFAIAFGLMVWIGAYDTFFLDWVLFANMKRFRMEGTEHMALQGIWRNRKEGQTRRLL
ncbi:MAG: hypothetical protein NC389_07935 [Acetatifactor muris]|nr:hypothetical protein [Acetatifactor muris]